MLTSIRYIEKVLFTRELAMLLQGGVSLGEALHSVEAKGRSRAFQGVVRSLVADIENELVLR